MLAGDAGADPAYLEELRERLELDRPLPYQVASYLSRVGRGDLGFSVVRSQPVSDAIGARLGASLLLSSVALLLAAVVGVVLGVAAAARRGGIADVAISAISLIGYSVPVFWLGQLLVALFAVRLRWLPAGGMRSVEGGSGAIDVARHLVLPAASLSLLLVALVVRVTRTSMIDALAQDYTTVARAKGLAGRHVLFRHALRNALRPVVTVLTGYFGLVLTGAVLVETVFVWPGLGQLLYASVLARDTPMLTGIVIFTTALVVLANIVADVLYRILDPRAGFR